MQGFLKGMSGMKALGGFIVRVLKGNTARALLLWAAYAMPNWLIYAYSDKAYFWLLPKLDSNWAFYRQALWVIQSIETWSKVLWQGYAAIFIFLVIKRGWDDYAPHFDKPGARMWVLIGSGALLGAGSALGSWSFEGLFMLSNETQAFAVTGTVFLSACVYAPIAEELFFRLILVNTLKKGKRRPLSPLAWQALLFGISHFYLDWEGKLWTLIFGAMVGLAFVAFKSVYVPIAIHAASNMASYAIEKATASVTAVPQKLLYNLLVLGTAMFVAATAVYVRDAVIRIKRRKLAAKA
ncbi:MAG: CPBP family intramembrane metalloprotease, partial [Clostridiales bacterium]|nr:CPBP family intramembrane metalloprotease [Clostridiales bacterium]